MKKKPSRVARRRYEDLPELVTPAEARAFLRVSKNVMYTLIQQQRVPSLRFGHLIRIPKSALVE